MQSSIIITLIICSTLIILSITSAIGKAIERKSINRQINDFSKAFPSFKSMETPEKKEEDFFKKF